MTKITVYDTAAERLEELEEKHEATTARIIEALLDAVDAGEINLNDWI